MLLKNSTVNSLAIDTNTIHEKNVDNGVTIDSVLVKDNSVTANSISTDTITEKTATNGVDIDGVLLKDGGISFDSGTTILKNVVFNIGDWNMVSTASLTVDISSVFTTAALVKKIRSIDVLIRDDNEVAFSKLAVNNINGVGTYSISASSTGLLVGLYREIGSVWDNANHDSISYNRGWITIWYVV